MLLLFSLSLISFVSGGRLSRDGLLRRETERYCPALEQPENVGFLVINLDRSPGRLQRMRDAFDGTGRKEVFSSERD